MWLYFWRPWHSQTTTPACYFCFGVLVLFLSAISGGVCVWLYLLVTLALTDKHPRLFFWGALVMFVSAVLGVGCVAVFVGDPGTGRRRP